LTDSSGYDEYVKKIQEDAEATRLAAEYKERYTIALAKANGLSLEAANVEGGSGIQATIAGLEQINTMPTTGSIEDLDSYTRQVAENIMTRNQMIAQSFAQSIGGTISASFEKGKFSTDKFFENIKIQMRNMLIEKGVEALITVILDAYSGGSGSAVSSLAGAMASGGPVEAGKSYLVGEDGIELFRPKQSGYIVPNDQLKSLPNNNININIGGNIIGNKSFVRDHLIPEIQRVVRLN